MTTNNTGDTTALVTEVALGSMTGLVAGYTLKKLGQLISFGVLAGYSSLQLAKMRGWVADHQIEAVSTTVKSLGQQGKEQLEANRPALENYMQGFTKIGVPSVISFGGGFYVGFFYG